MSFWQWAITPIGVLTIVAAVFVVEWVFRKERRS
jgi:hypothetical protein